MILKRPQKQVVNTKDAHSTAATSNARVFGIPLGLCARSVCLAVFVCALTIKLQSVPPVWWDEGWTLSVARNWVEQGHYGRLLNGQPAPAGFEAAFPITALVALSFRALGYGIHQARLVSVFLMMGTLALLFYLARCLYNRSVAGITLATSVVIPAFQDLHPVFIGRQVLGEGPALLFLLASYICLLAGTQRKIWMTIVAGVLAGLAINIKAQVLPFWVLSMLIPTFSLLYLGRWKCAGLFGATLTSGLLMLPALTWLWRYVLQQPSYARGAVPGLYEVTALVTSIPSRLFALIVLVLFGLPTLFGIGYSICKILKSKDSLKTHTDWVRSSLLVLVSTWLCWYVLASVGWTRYLFPASFIGSIFVSAMLCDLMNRFDLSSLSKTFSFSTKLFRSGRSYWGPLFAVLLICISIPRTVLMFYRVYVVDADSSVLQAAEFLNQTVPGSLIETYDAELFFLLNKSYHYPPDSLNIQLVRRTFLYQETTTIDYDPLAADPDYLVVGPHSKQWKLYDRVLQTGAFRLVRTYPRYRLYERVR